MNARVVTETEAASSALREHLSDLRSRLESLGMQIEHIDIETDSGETSLGSPFDNDNRGDRWNDQREDPSSRPFSARNKNPVSRTVSSASGVTSLRRVTTVGLGVDLHL